MEDSTKCSVSAVCIDEGQTSQVSSYDAMSGFSLLLPCHSPRPIHHADKSHCTCTAVSCPEHTSGTVPGDSGTGGMSGCTVDAGYSGGVTATTSDPYYTTAVAGARCYSAIRASWPAPSALV